eukprot:UN33562
MGMVHSFGNPYDGAQFFSNPHYQTEVEAAMSKYPDNADLLSKAKDFSAAIWLDTIAVMNANLTNYLDMAAKQASSKPLVIQFIVYDLPDRDCSAKASNGEIPCEDSSCAQGLNRYQTDYIDVIKRNLKRTKIMRIYESS